LRLRGAAEVLVGEVALGVGRTNHVAPIRMALLAGAEVPGDRARVVDPQQLVERVVAVVVDGVEDEVRTGVSRLRRRRRRRPDKPGDAGHGHCRRRQRAQQTAAGGCLRPVEPPDRRVIGAHCLPPWKETFGSQSRCVQRRYTLATIEVDESSASFIPSWAQLGGGRNWTSCWADSATTSSGFWSAIASMPTNRS